MSFLKESLDSDVHIVCRCQYTSDGHQKYFFVNISLFWKAPLFVDCMVPCLHVYLLKNFLNTHHVQAY